MSALIIYKSFPTLKYFTFDIVRFVVILSGPAGIITGFGVWFLKKWAVIVYLIFLIFYSLFAIFGPLVEVALLPGRILLIINVIFVVYMLSRWENFK